jgi:hypothetical protein
MTLIVKVSVSLVDAKYFGYFGITSTDPPEKPFLIIVDP